MPKKGYKQTKEHKEKIRQNSLEQFKDGMPQETKDKLREKNTGLKRTEETKDRIRKGHVDNSGEKNPNWVDRIEWICPICQKVLLLTLCAAKKRKFCSPECNGKAERSQETINKMSGKNHYMYGKTGDKHPQFKGKLLKKSNGRWYIWIDNKRTKNARYLVEQILERKLLKEEIIHHIGVHYPMNSIENRGDDSPENLYLFPSQSKHCGHHGFKITPILKSNLNLLRDKKLKNQEVSQVQKK